MLHVLWAEPLYSPIKWVCLRNFYLLSWMVRHRSSIFVAFLFSLHCSRISSFIKILLARCVLQIVAVARTWSKTFQQRHPPYPLGMVLSIADHCISRSCSSHMVRHTSIGWWRILKAMAHTSLVYIIHFRNPRRWQNINVVGILFLWIWLYHVPSCCQLLGAWFFTTRITCIFLNGFLIALHWYSHVNHISRKIFCFFHYHIVSIPVYPSLSLIRDRIFHWQWCIINSRNVLQRWRW